jgi:dTDP-4-amino-4,6-dideoxygalactose transaminase
MLNTLFSPWPAFSDEEAEAVKQVLLSNRVSYWTGQECRSFEKEFADYMDCNHAVALGNGTQALEVALHALDIQPGDEVITTPRTYFATASAIVMLGATPVFADVDRYTQNITAETIEAVRTPKTKAVIVVHLAGMPADMDPIMALASKHALKVIEDCAQAHGASIDGKRVGSWGVMGCFSFYPTKNLGAIGDGGAVVTSDAAIQEHLTTLRQYGWKERFVSSERGINSRLDELQAAVLLFP